MGVGWVQDGGEMEVDGGGMNTGRGMSRGAGPFAARRAGSDRVGNAQLALLLEEGRRQLLQRLERGLAVAARPDHLKT